MKKIFMVLVILFCFPVMLFADETKSSYLNLEDSLKDEGINADLGGYVESPDKVTIYLFRGKGCSHCEEFLKYVSSTLIKEYGDYFNFKSYEVWSNKDNAALAEKVGNKLNLEVGYVPFIVIGDKGFIGYASRNNGMIENQLKKAYEEQNRVDVVEQVLNEEDSTSNDESVSNTDDEVNDEEEVKDNEKENNLYEKEEETFFKKPAFLALGGLVLGLVILVIVISVINKRRGVVKK